DRRLELATRLYMARARHSRGELGAAIAMLQDVIRALKEMPHDDFLDLPVLPAAYAPSALAASLAEVGEFEAAAPHAREAARRAEASGQPDTIMWTYWNIGLVALLRGESQDAVRVFNRLLDLCRTYDLEAYASRIMAALGCSMARTGRIDE